MRALVPWIAGLILALYAPAAAQEPRRWTDPTGSYSLALGADWNELPLDPSDPKVVLAVEYLPGNARGEMRMCSVRVLGNGIVRPDVTQEAVNTLVERMSAQQQQASFEGTHNHRVRHSEMRGVAIADSMFESEQFYSHNRLFTLRTRDRAMHVHILCGGSLPFSDGDKAMIDAFVSTLTFPGLDQTP